MTFHTFEVGVKLSGQQFKKINNKFKEYNNQYFDDPDVDDRRIFKGLSNNGILISLYIRKVDNNGFICYISYRINPIRIMDGNDYANLFHSNNADKIYHMVNLQLEKVSYDLPKIDECILQRFDFCSNVILENNKAVKEFISLINSSYLPNDEFVQKTNYDKRSGRDNPPKEEATFTRKDYVEVSFYNKIGQLVSENLPTNWNGNILRCEIRCHKRYIDSLKQKFQVKTIEEFLLKLPEIGTYVYEYQMRKLGLSNTYLHLDDINIAIDNTSNKAKTKNKMKAFVKAAAMHKGIVNAIVKDIIPNAGKIIRRFSEIGINPMPLPYRSSLPSGINLLDLCLKFADKKKIIEIPSYS